MHNGGWTGAGEQWDGVGTGSTRVPVLSYRQEAAAREVIRRVRRRVQAELVHSLLFGSRARGDARPDSDVDILLIFRELPPDREPQAGQAEQIADEVAAESWVPVATWSVALVDLEVGKRTPMLVDALEDALPLWPADVPPPRPSFTPYDAVRCASALLDRVEEGGAEVAERLREHHLPAAAHRARGDIVRLCTAALLLHGETRPRRAEAVRRFILRFGDDPKLVPAIRILTWAAESYGPDGSDEERPVGPPPGGFASVTRAVQLLVRLVAAERARLCARLSNGRNLDGGRRIPPYTELRMHGANAAGAGGHTDCP